MEVFVEAKVEVGSEVEVEVIGRLSSTSVRSVFIYLFQFSVVVVVTLCIYSQCSVFCRSVLVYMPV